ncbi:hypothetical protein GCM10007423_39950 [Dyadobacter endophyticus]|uniref:Uncharacterized protein n=1 Tax=Dyadobacter endophyticus TaxID=1749036 RepID=A0ABQ1YZS6_9BACT|nr:hypothetical protein [Dyadobacter endophyticus]GGH42943.1 hypothetical protein GCM10007423_39950 [Dyadobacter endophyticus]
MIHHHVSTINASLACHVPRKCGENVWDCQINGLGKLVWSSQDKGVRIHDQSDEWIVRDDKFHLQTCHIVDRVRKTRADFNIPVYTVECSLVGVGKTKTGGLLAFSVFESLESSNIYASEFDNNTERVLTSYWGIKREDFGQNPEYNAFRIAYSYTLPTLDRDDLMFLEGLTDLD